MLQPGTLSAGSCAALASREFSLLLEQPAHRAPGVIMELCSTNSVQILLWPQAKRGVVTSRGHQAKLKPMLLTGRVGTACFLLLHLATATWGYPRAAAGWWLGWLELRAGLWCTQTSSRVAGTHRKGSAYILNCCWYFRPVCSNQTGRFHWKLFQTVGSTLPLFFSSSAGATQKKKKSSAFQKRL